MPPANHIKWHPCRRWCGLSLALIVAGLCAACSRVPPVPVPEPEVPDRYSGSVVDGSHQPLAWWESFADPILNQVVEVVLASNFDLAQAVARVDQARASARIANATVFPLMQPSAGVVDFSSTTNAGLAAQLDELGLGSELSDRFGVTLPDRVGLTTYSISAEFSYELDFWGRNRNIAHAAGAERLASESDFVAARMGILAETIYTYLEIVELKAQLAHSLEIERIMQERESLAAFRYDSGLEDVRFLYAARRNLRDASARLSQLEAGFADAQGRLWVLLGGRRADLVAGLPDSLTTSVAFREPVPTGIPADLLVQRPDVSAARQRMEAARFTAGARRAELLPALSLSGSIGLQSTRSGDWFDPDQWFRNLSVNLLGPAFQGARLSASVDLAEARLSEAAAAYGQSVVTAVSEVEAALAALDASRRRHDLSSSYLEEAQLETASQEQRYVAGTGSYEEVLLATQVLLGAKSLLAAVERDLGYARLALHRALGGAWTAGETQKSSVRNK